MQKKVMALAVAGALAAPAVALAQSNVQIYGRINAGLDSYTANGGTTVAASKLEQRYRMFDQGSRLGVRGSEDLGNGLKAIFVIESGLNIDTGSAQTQSGSANASAGTFASRDSYVGLEGGWGRFTMGRQALWYGNGVIEQATSNYVNTGASFFSGTMSRGNNGPTTRTNNAFVYTTPTAGGFNGSLWYAPQAEGVQAISGAAGATNQDTKAKIYGFTLRYTGVLNAQLDWGKNKKNTNSFFPSNGTANANIGPTGTVATVPAAGDVTGTKLGVGWPYAPGAQISVIFIQAKVEKAVVNAGFTAAGDDVKQKGWGLSWEHVFGNVQALAQYAKLSKITGCTESVGAVAGVSGATCSGTDATQYMLGAKYLLSKRSSVYVTYNQTTNKENAALDYQPAGYSAVAGAGAPVGSDPRVWAIGMMHNF
jgi:predicted porin